MAITQYADFGLQKKRPDSQGNITDLLVHRREADDSMTYLGWYTRAAIIEHIEQGNTYMTIEIKDGIWHKGAEVHVVRTAHGKYLRTDRNSIARDNLDNLPNG
jgi:hypothetical protein